MPRMSPLRKRRLRGIVFLGIFLKRRVEIGILYSRSGNYQLISDACRTGVLSAIDAVNADSTSPIEFEAVERDPGGNIDRYAEGCADILANSSARHIIGCVTSWSRKEVIPTLERSDGTLWYACPYEGFEANDHVVYMHACPNQHLVPMLAHVVPRFGANGFLLGSNYIWGWETNRVARDLVADAGGKVLGERYLPIGETDVSRLIAEIEATRPNFVLNNLIGTSSYAFFAAYAELAARDPHFGPDRCPILSCNLTECELPAIEGVGDGHLSAGPYFHDASAHGWPETISAAMPASSIEATAHACVRVLAEILGRNPDAQWSDLPNAFSYASFQTPLGKITVDPQTQHATLPVQIGCIEGTAFKTVSLTEGVAPDPYLSRYDRHATFGRPGLRVVS